MIEAWNKGSGEAFAAPFTEQADFIAFDFTRSETREGETSCNGFKGSPPVCGSIIKPKKRRRFTPRSKAQDGKS
jgi:hypothetical protein